MRSDFDNFPCQVQPARAVNGRNNGWGFAGGGHFEQRVGGTLAGELARELLRPVPTPLGLSARGIPASRLATPPYQCTRVIVGQCIKMIHA